MIVFHSLLMLLLNTNRFLSPSECTLPVKPTFSPSQDDSFFKVASSPWLATNLLSLLFRRPTTYARKGVLSRLNSTVYVYDIVSKLRSHLRSKDAKRLSLPQLWRPGHP
jgi:hypothetical protein